MVLFWVTRFTENDNAQWQGKTMHYNNEQIAELNILIRFSLDTSTQGIKVHSTANEDEIEAVDRLFDKGLVTQSDGGYLTDLGRRAAEHAQALLLILSSHTQTVAS